jgi:hypothetical protein
MGLLRSLTAEDFSLLLDKKPSQNLKSVEDSLVQSMHSFIDYAKLSSAQVESFHMLLDNFYRHGVACSSDSQAMIDRLQDELRRYK